MSIPAVPVRRIIEPQRSRSPDVQQDDLREPPDQRPHGHDPKEITDARRSSEVLVALSFESREAVDAFADAAVKAGGKADIRAPQDLGFMYSRSVEDPDGHVFEPMWMDPSAIEGAEGAETAHA
jgi:hypothetical protein